MYSSRLTGKALLLAFAALSITGCNSESGSSAVAAEAADTDPYNVDTEALRAAVSDDRVRGFYESVQWNAVWNEDHTRQLLEAIEGAEVHALSSKAFLEGELPDDPAQREAALTKAALDYGAALADGFVDPGEIREIYTVARPKTDVVTGLAQAVSQDQVGQWLASLAPQTDQYRALSNAFVRYARHAQSGQESAIASGDSIHAGDADPRVPRLVEALAANGYLNPQQLQQPNPQTYTQQIAQAVQRLQQDYGISDDGIVGPGTLEVLNAGARDRARQLAVNLERLRWLERDAPATRIDVNTAAAFLDYWRDGQHRDQRRVVVGEPGWETPALGSPMYRLVANPTWTVPKSIEQDELSNVGPSYLSRNNMVRRDGWIVQLPGPDNALGEVKFDMKNDHAIYLHDTPAKALFSQNERHRSHGCVRVHEALQFARMIAEHDGIGSQFEQALASGDESFVSLNTDIPVRLLYHTAFLRDGKVQFRTDAYGWDEDVARALGREASERRVLQTHQRGRDIGP